MLHDTEIEEFSLGLKSCYLNIKIGDTLGVKNNLRFNEYYKGASVYKGHCVVATKLYILDGSFACVLSLKGYVHQHYISFKEDVLIRKTALLTEKKNKGFERKF